MPFSSTGKEDGESLTLLSGKKGKEKKQYQIPGKKTGVFLFQEKEQLCRGKKGVLI